MRVGLDRTVTRIHTDGRAGTSQPLSRYREQPAFVLLGDSGAGKTTVFETEETHSHGEARVVSARDFLTFKPKAHPEWRTHTLLIDGLDEVRAGKADPRKSFDRIRRRLDELGKPRFRISCREAEWYGAVDRESLDIVSPNQEVVVLRLDSLNEDESRRLASACAPDGDPAEFLRAVSDRGLEGLLRNPQSLVMQAEVFWKTGRLPLSRLETFEQATALMATEPNKRYRFVHPGFPLSTILEAAGWLSTAQLLSGAVGHCLTDHDVEDEYISNSVLRPDMRIQARAALRTRLFEAPTEGRRRFRPMHANVAAFLAARTLADLVRHGLPKRPVLGLLAGEDGAPPTPLRALVAWLAAVSPELRRLLIERDPVAVLMYGDVRDFTPGEKSFLLDEIARDPSRLSEGRWPTSAVEGLASPDMESTLRDLLENPDRSDSTQHVVRVAARALANAPTAGALSESLLKVCRDGTRRFSVRLGALDAWIRSVAGATGRDCRLRMFLRALRDGEIDDHGGEFLGTLLREMYPETLEPSELWSCFDVPSEPLIGRFYMFWHSLPDVCPEGHLPDHLDHLAQSGQARSIESDLPRPRGLPVRFLARGLRSHGEPVDTQRLIRWLRTGLTEWGDLTPQGSEAAAACVELAKWFESHPDSQKRVIRAALRGDEFRRYPVHQIGHFVNQLLYGSSLPADIGDWHLEEAAGAEQERLTEIHVREFLTALARTPGTSDASLSDARAKLASRSGALTALEAGLRSDLPEDYLDRRISLQHVRADLARADDPLIEAVRQERALLLENRGSPLLLHHLAQKYYLDVGRAGLPEALGPNRDGTDPAIRAIRTAPDRSDLPLAEEVLRLWERNQESPFMWPVLVGLAGRTAHDVLPSNDQQLRTWLALRLVGLGLAQEAPWYRRCAIDRAELVSEVLVLLGRAFLQKGETSIPDFHSLVHDATHEAVARQATLPLLQAFPVRAKSEQLHLLDQLLWSALRLSDSEAFHRVIERKLASRTMSLSQRVRWLAAGLASSPASFLPRIEQCIEDTAAPVGGLAAFFSPSYPVTWLNERLDTAAIAFLIRTIGRQFEPIQEEGLITIRTEAADSVRGLIAGLAESPDPDATAALTSLAVDPELTKWRWPIERAEQTQRIVRRDANYRPPTASEIVAALGNGPPINVTHLRELVVDGLERVATEVKDTSQDNWQLFWNQDSRERPTEPKAENPCRDAVLTLLLPKLPEGFTAAQEAVAAGKKRADMGIWSGRLRVPVEVKKNSASDLWRGVRYQLLPRYTNDPATEGLGIYLVLWFGPAHTTPVEEGPRPSTPPELREQLLARLTAEERRRAAVLVMDVTPPLTSHQERRVRRDADGT